MKASEKNKDARDIDCYKSFELVLLACFYTVLTGLYLTASSIIQLGFVAVISSVMLVTHCTRFLGCRLGDND
jgi:site-specific recombinase